MLPDYVIDLTATVTRQSGIRSEGDGDDAGDETNIAWIRRQQILAGKMFLSGFLAANLKKECSQRDNAIGTGHAYAYSSDENPQGAEVERQRAEVFSGAPQR